MIDIGVTLATIKALAGVAKDANKIPLYNDIIGLQQTILEMQEERLRAVDDSSRLRVEVAELRDKCRELEGRLAVRESLVFENNVYWRPDGSNDQGALCPKCFDGSGKLSRMMTREDSDYWTCPVCALSVQKPDTDPHGDNIREIHRPLRQGY